MAASGHRLSSDEGRHQLHPGLWGWPPRYLEVRDFDEDWTVVSLNLSA